MSRLHNPGIGERLDRITILELKEKHTLDNRAFRDERTALEATLPVLAATVLTEVDDLRNVNAQLWDAEDQLRDLRAKHVLNVMTESQTYDAMRCAFRIQELNDERADLIRSLNESAGDFWLEKL